MSPIKITNKTFELFLVRNFYCLLIYNRIKKNSGIELLQPMNSPTIIKQFPKAAQEFILGKANELLLGASFTLICELAKSSFNPRIINLKYPFDSVILEILTDVHFRDALELLHFYNYPTIDIIRILGDSYGDRDYSKEVIESYLYYFYDLSGFSRWSVKEKQIFVEFHRKFTSTRQAYRRQIASLTSGLDFEDSLISVGLKSLVREISKDYLFRASVKASKLVEAKTTTDNVTGANGWLKFIKDIHAIPDEFPMMGGKKDSFVNFIPFLPPPEDLEEKKKR